MPSISLSPTIAPDGCFGAYDVLELKSGERKMMNEVSIGDSILVALPDKDKVKLGDELAIISSIGSYENKSELYSSSPYRFAYSPVIALPHSTNNKIKSKFLIITLISGVTLQMTPTHLLFSGKCSEADSISFTLLPASNLEADLSCVETTSGRQMVTEIKSVYLEGVYTAVPLDGEYIVVNGVIASPFAGAHYLGHRFYDVHRFVHLYFPSWLLSSSLFMNTMREVGEMVVSYVSYL